MQNQIDERLSAPQRQEIMEDLPRLWRHTEITVSCTAPPFSTTPIDLLRKIRGAVGYQLLAGASAATRDRKPCDWDPPCALDFLYRHRSIPGLKAGAPSPFVLSADVGGEGLLITLTLFGFAEACAAEAAEALVRGLRSGLSIDDRGGGGVIEPLHRRIRAVPNAVLSPPTGGSISLIFQTPVASRNDGKPVTAPAAILRGTFDRVVGLARWYGIDVVSPASWLADRLATMTIEASEFEQTAREFRPSISASADGYWIQPAAGKLQLGGNWLSLWPLLAIGEVIHAGGRATDGYGRFRLVGG